MGRTSGTLNKLAERDLEEALGIKTKRRKPKK